MPRPQVFKIAYVVIIGTLASLAVTILVLSGAPFWAWLVVAILMFVPGRIAGYYFRQFFVGRSRMLNERWVDAITSFEAFIDRVRKHPGIKNFVWLTFPIYTTDIEAMAKNNIGASYLELGRIGDAEELLQQALALDPKYPIPYYNLALVEHLRGNVVAAEEHRSAATRLGWNGNWSDVVVQRLADAYSRFEARVGRGAA